ncbi:hypothetical protein [Streptomyces sp. CS014]|uniref:hypothetical protein n=1 Tax=Streptomyces sp. CS014 TaxID=2162707 RepID=UPI000D51D619|nr:hypothetical protein [Streptomyces sp. CS014]PVD01352.1 hypothetical protein DBP12_07490 [Streptomyces sp. CS014]
MPIAVVRAETYYVPPPPRRGQPPLDWSGVPAAELVYLWMEARMGRRLPLPTETVDETYYAQINQNRWCALCVCGSAAIVSPTDPRFGCTECGYGWVTLIFPEDVDTVEEQLLLEPRPHLRNWWHPDDPANPYDPPQPPPPFEPEPQKGKGR